MVAVAAEAVGPAFEHQAADGVAQLGHKLVLRLKLVVERVARAVAVERRRQLACEELVFIHARDAQTPVEGVNHPRRRGVSGYSVKFILDIVRVERRGQHVPVVVQKELPRLYAARRVAHDGDVVRVYIVGVRVGADEAHGAGHVQRALLLRVGPQPVVHDEGLEAQLPQMRRRGQMPARRRAGR